MSGKQDKPDKPKASVGSKSIRSVEIGARVLDALMESNEPLPLRDIAEAANLSRSQAHRYLAAYVNTGFVVPDDTVGHYSLGPYALRLGLAAYAQLDISAVARNAIDSLVKDTNLTGIVTIWGSHGPTIIRWTHGRPPVATSFGLGSVLPMLSSTAGHTFLAFLPDTYTEKLVQRELKRMPDAKQFNLKNMKDKVRTAGYARGLGTVIPGLTSISAPILNQDGEAAAVLGLIDRSTNPICKAAIATRKLLATAAEASKDIGYIKKRCEAN